MPIDATGADSIQGAYARRGEDELAKGDVLFEGEANHHRQNRGWDYAITALTEEGKVLKVPTGDFAWAKSRMKANGMPVDYLKGSGDIAAMVRVAHGLRMGYMRRPDAEAPLPQPEPQPEPQLQPQPEPQ